jgi:hypothetical protein
MEREFNDMKDVFKILPVTKEENFYIIGASPTLTVEINGVSIPDPDNILNSQGAITNVEVFFLSIGIEVFKYVIVCEYW